MHDHALLSRTTHRRKIAPVPAHKQRVMAATDFYAIPGDVDRWARPAGFTPVLADVPSADESYGAGQVKRLLR